MKSRSVLFVLSVIVSMITLAACGAAAMEAPATEAPAAIEAPASGIDEFGAVEQPADSAVDGEALPKSSDALLAPAPTMAAFEIGNPSGSGENTVVQNTNRKIIKLRSPPGGQIRSSSHRSTQIIRTWWLPVVRALVSGVLWEQSELPRSRLAPWDQFERASRACANYRSAAV